MTRFLPIAMLALGLVLLSTSFASAQTVDQHASDLATVCTLDMAGTAETAMEPPAEALGRCWKKLGVSMIVPGCTVHAQMPAACTVEPPRTKPAWESAAPLIVLEGIAPPLALPPPRA